MRPFSALSRRGPSLRLQARSLIIGISEAWVGDVAGVVALEQFPSVLSGGGWSGRDQSVGSIEDEDPTSRRLEATVSAVWTGPFSKEPRRGAPVDLFRDRNRKAEVGLYFRGGEVAHPPYFGELPREQQEQLAERLLREL